MNRNEIKAKALEDVKKFMLLNDEDFNRSATSFKIEKDYNLVIWCDIAEKFVEEDEEHRYYIVSIRYNPGDELFGDDIGFEWDTQDNSEEELCKVIDKVLDMKEATK